MSDFKYKIRFNYHVVDGIHWRTTKLWWKPMMWFGNKLQKLNYWYYKDKFLFGKFHWWIRKYITFD